MKFSITGVNHKTAPIEVRERLNFEQSALPAALAELKRCPGIIEGMILSTCNRVEIVVYADEETDSAYQVRKFLTTNRRMASGSITPYLYQHEGDDAIRHLFRVAASLDSMVIGEPQILGQLKSAYAAAKAEGAITGSLDTLVTRALSVAKRIRTETGIGQSAVSISYVAVELARQIFGKLDKRTVMVVGAGKMSELAARHLSRAGASQIFVTNRTHDRAVELAVSFGGQVVDYDRYRSVLKDIDIVITSSTAPHYILKKDHIQEVIEARRNKPMFLIDIAVPRNIESAVNDIDNVFLYDIDDLQDVIDENLRGRMKEAEEAETIVNQEVERMVSRLKVREITPTIVGLQEQLENLRCSELQRVQGRLSSLTPEEREAVDALTRGLVNKIAHGPITELRRQAAQPDGIHFIEVIRRVFRLDS